VIQLPEDRRPPISPSLALRIAVMGGIALVLFAVVFFRLWYLQVLSGDQYVSQANQNQVREVRIQAPRGQIVDRYGRQIVTNRIARVVQVELAKLPAAGRDETLTTQAASAARGRVLADAGLAGSPVR